MVRILNTTYCHFCMRPLRSILTSNPLLSGNVAKCFDSHVGLSTMSLEKSTGRWNSWNSEDFLSAQGKWMGAAILCSHLQWCPWKNFLPTRQLQGWKHLQQLVEQVLHLFKLVVSHGSQIFRLKCIAVSHCHWILELHPDRSAGFHHKICFLNCGSLNQAAGL
jgi:hypothetical protein